jgi:Zn-dependent oligopeptidase
MTPTGLPAFPCYASLLTLCRGAHAENVVTFLTGIAQRLRPVAEQEIQALQKLKTKSERSNDPIYAWDRPYYSGVHVAPKQNGARPLFGLCAGMGFAAYGSVPTRARGCAGIARSLTSVSGEGARLSEYFSLGGVIDGLSDIFSHLFGVRLVPAPTLPGELWAGDVHKLAVMHESEVGFG